MEIRVSKFQGLQVTCNAHKFEIPALLFPRKDPVNPCKHLQCIFQEGSKMLKSKWHFVAKIVLVIEKKF